MYSGGNSNHIKQGLLLHYSGNQNHENAFHRL